MISKCTPLTANGRKLESLCRKALYEYNLTENPKIAIALSGGKDSLTLLHLLKSISGRGFPDFDLYAIHVSGEFSCGPGITKNYLNDICKELDVPLSIVESTQTRSKLECYSCSRERRKLLFDEAKAKGFQTIAFGHHLDDSIETLLMNLFHKGEFAANLPKVPMHDYGVAIIRPLIYISESEIFTFAKQQGFARFMCQCPVGQNSKRREVKNLINEIEAIFPNVRNNLGLASRESGSKKALNK